MSQNAMQPRVPIQSHTASVVRPSAQQGISANAHLVRPVAMPQNGELVLRPHQPGTVYVQMPVHAQLQPAQPGVVVQNSVTTPLRYMTTMPVRQAAQAPRVPTASVYPILNTNSIQPNHNGGGGTPRTTFVSVPGAPAQSFIHDDVSEEIRNCQEFFVKLLEPGTPMSQEQVLRCRQLIQLFINGNIPCDTFVKSVYDLLDSKSDATVAPFLEKTVPRLRICMAMKRIGIAGIAPPSLPSNISPATLTHNADSVSLGISPASMVIPNQHTQLHAADAQRVMELTQSPRRSDGASPVARAMYQQPIQSNNYSPVSSVSGQQVVVASSTASRVLGVAASSPMSLHQDTAPTIIDSVRSQSLPQSQPLHPQLPIYSGSSGGGGAVYGRLSPRMSQPVARGSPQQPQMLPTSAQTVSPGVAASIGGPIAPYYSPTSHQSSGSLPPHSLRAHTSSMSPRGGINSSGGVAVQPFLLKQHPAPPSDVTARRLAGSHALPPRGRSIMEGVRDDDEVNDVASMAGINVSSEQRMLTVSPQLLIRSARDEPLISVSALQHRITSHGRSHGLSTPSDRCSDLLSSATRSFLNHVLEQAIFASQMRSENLRANTLYERSQTDVRGAVKFLAELDRRESKSRADAERESILRAASSSKRNQSSSNASVMESKQRARDLCAAEASAAALTETSATALAAIGSTAGARKRARLDANSPVPVPPSVFRTAAASPAPPPFPSSSHISAANPPRYRSNVMQRIKQVAVRDVLFVLEDEHRFRFSSRLFRTLSYKPHIQPHHLASITGGGLQPQSRHFTSLTAGSTISDSVVAGPSTLLHRTSIASTSHDGLHSRSASPRNHRS